MHFYFYVGNAMSRYMLPKQDAMEREVGDIFEMDESLGEQFDQQISVKWLQWLMMMVMVMMVMMVMMMVMMMMMMMMLRIVILMMVLLTHVHHDRSPEGPGFHFLGEILKSLERAPFRSACYNCWWLGVNAIDCFEVFCFNEGVYQFVG